MRPRWKTCFLRRHARGDTESTRLLRRQAPLQACNPFCLQSYASAAARGTADSAYVRRRGAWQPKSSDGSQQLGTKNSPFPNPRHLDAMSRNGGPSARVKAAALSRTVPTSARPGPRNAHSHMTSTRQPLACSAETAFRSRAALASNFVLQKSCRVAGSFDNAQPCACQKQPWMKTATRHFEKTRSGRPGKVLSCRR